jgi:DNA-binding NtrC family response regulator
MERHVSELSVLLIDPQRHMRQVLAPILRQAGIRQISAADSVREGAAALPARKPDLIFIDYDPAPTDAMDFVQYARIPGRGWNHQVPLVLLALQPDVTMICAARDAGVNDILAKPLTTATVIDRLRRTLLNPRNFVDDPTFRGPERRRRASNDDDAPRRRTNDKVSSTG